jgi:hypothetical protein
MSILNTFRQSGGRLALTCIIHKLSITMLNYRQNTSVLIKFDLKIVHYFLHQICLRLLAFFDI